MKTLLVKWLNAILLTIPLLWLMACQPQKDPAPKPVASFEYYSSTTLYAPVTITFQNTSQHATSYVWTYGTGKTSTDEDLTLNFNSAGTYTITLKATGEGGTDTYSRTVVINAPLNPYGSGNGRLAFWSDLKTGGYIDIVVNNSTQTLKYNWTSAPTCDNVNTAAFILPAGTYKYEATNSNLKWSGSVTVNSGQCQLVGLKESDGQATGLPFGAVAKVTVKSKSGTTVNFTLDMVVVDQNNKFVEGLSTNNFSIQNFTSNGYSYNFGNASVGAINGANQGSYSAALLLDQSGSISGTDPQNYRIDAAKIFCNSLGSGDNVTLFAFAGSGRLIPYEVTRYGNGFTNNGASYNGTLDGLKTQIGGGTPLYKATASTLDYTAQNAPNTNRAVVVFTDGEADDTGLDNVINQANQQKVKLFTVGLGSAKTADLAYMANKTGGTFMFAQDARQLITMFGTLGQLLNGTTRLYRTSWQLNVNQNLSQSGWWMSTSVKVSLPNGSVVYVPFRVDY